MGCRMRSCEIDLTALTVSSTTRGTSTSVAQYSLMRDLVMYIFLTAGAVRKLLSECHTSRALVLVRAHLLHAQHASTTGLNWDVVSSSTLHGIGR